MKPRIEIRPPGPRFPERISPATAASSPVAGRCASPWPSSSSRSPRCCCSTNRRTTSTSARRSGSRNISSTTRARSSSFPTIAACSTRSAPAPSPSIHGRAEEYAGNFSYYERESVLRKEIQLKQYDRPAARDRGDPALHRPLPRVCQQGHAGAVPHQDARKIERIPATRASDDAVMNVQVPAPTRSGHIGRQT
jgi:hypothetical protein